MYTHIYSHITSYYIMIYHIILHYIILSYVKGLVHAGHAGELRLQAGRVLCHGLDLSTR